MGKRGPKPKTASQREQSGNAGKRRPKADAPSIPLATAPQPPDWLSDRGKQVWREIAPDLVARNVLTAADQPALGLLCQSWDDFHQHSAEIQNSGHSGFTDKGYEYTRPAVQLKAKAMDLIIRLSQRFGLTPMDRVGLGGAEKKGSKNPNNPLEDELGKK